jgi:hypothetical protein
LAKVNQVLVFAIKNLIRDLKKKKRRLIAKPLQLIRKQLRAQSQAHQLQHRKKRRLRKSILKLQRRPHNRRKKKKPKPKGKSELQKKLKLLACKLLRMRLTNMPS